MMGRALLSVATQDVIQLQQLPLSVSQFDDTGRICNDDECFLQSLLTLCSCFILFPHLPSLGSSTRAIQVLCGGGGFISEQPCVCSYWSAVCVNTEPSAHSADWVFGQCVKWTRCLDRGITLSARFFLRKTNPDCTQGRDGCNDQIQFFRQEHPGFA